MVVVSRANPARVTHASVGPGESRDRPHVQVVVGAKEGAEAQSLGLQRDAQQVVVRRALLRFSEHSQFHSVILRLDS